MKKLKLALKRFFCKPDVSGSISIGEMDKDRFAPVLMDGKETNCRIYLWDAEDVKRLQSIGNKNKNLIKK